jgi:hypothetical protein
MLRSNGPSCMEGGAFKYKKKNLAVLYALWIGPRTTRCFGQMDLLVWREVLSNTKKKTLQCFTLSNRPSYNAFPPSGTAPHSHVHRWKLGPFHSTWKAPLLAMTVGARFLNVVEFIWSHIFEQCSRRKGASRRGACAQKSYFGRTFGGVYKFWNFFLSWANQSGSLQIIIIKLNFGMHHLTTN